MTTIPTLFVYFLYDHIPTFFYIFKEMFFYYLYIYTSNIIMWIYIHVDTSNIIIVDY